MVPEVVHPHRRLVDGGLQCVVIIRQLGQLQVLGSSSEENTALRAGVTSGSGFQGLGLNGLASTEIDRASRKRTRGKSRMEKFDEKIDDESNFDLFFLTKNSHENE